MTDRELMQQALSVLCNNVQPRDGFRENRHLVPKSHAAIYQQTIDALREGLAQPEQEPVAWYDKHGMVTHDPFEGIRPLYAAPRPWVGLTDEEIKEIIGPWGDTPIKGYTRKLFDQIENKLKEKNGAA
jgi:hypothetical protein